MGKFLFLILLFLFGCGGSSNSTQSTAADSSNSSNSNTVNFEDLTYTFEIKFSKVNALDPNTLEYDAILSDSNQDISIYFTFNYKDETRTYFVSTNDTVRHFGVYKPFDGHFQVEVKTFGGRHILYDEIQLSPQ